MLSRERQRAPRTADDGQIAVRPAQLLRFPAVTSTPGYPREVAAYHECGHAAAHWNLGLAFEYVTLSKPPHLQPLRTGTISTVFEKWLYSVAGIVADYQHRGLFMEDAQIGILLTGGAEQFELTDPSTRLAVMRPLRANAVGRGQDLEELAGVATDGGWTVENCASMWRDCELYVKSLEPAISALAGRLLVAETMTAAEVSAVAGPAMRNKPAPVVPDWAVRETCTDSTQRLAAPRGSAITATSKTPGCGVQPRQGHRES